MIKILLTSLLLLTLTGCGGSLTKQEAEKACLSHVRAEYKGITRYRVNSSYSSLFTKRYCYIYKEGRLLEILDDKQLKAIYKGL